MRIATPLDQPRAVGQTDVSSKVGPRGSCIDGLRQSGALKLLFPKHRHGVEAVIINTAGGVTGGDQFDLSATAGEKSRLTLTTQAAERAYKAHPGQIGQMNTRLNAQANSTLHWLPQELILFQSAALKRSLRVDLAPGARFLMSEAVLFGRRAMGETVTNVSFDDHIDIRRDGVPLYRDGVRMTGDAAGLMQRPATGSGAAAMASVVWVAPEAQGKLADIRTMLGAQGGASLLGPDLMVMRLLAEDGFALRRILVPILDQLTENTLPQCWRL